METVIVAEYPNADTGCTAVVARISRGLSVVLRDDDSGLLFPEARVYPGAADDDAVAHGYARSIVNV